ncbi:unnamed protein product [Amoebophrya sp. A25]|nr:unnamed protein product [Amoebophrya sp. A25]|eukprot:GSA25T00006527001.1
MSIKGMAQHDDVVLVHQGTARPDQVVRTATDQVELVRSHERVVWNYERERFRVITDPEVLRFLHQVKNEAHNFGDIKQSTTREVDTGSTATTAGRVVLDHLYRRKKFSFEGEEQYLMEEDSESDYIDNETTWVEEYIAVHPHPYVKTISLHEEDNFPHFRCASSLDVGLPTGMGDDEYLPELSKALTELQKMGEMNVVLCDTSSGKNSFESTAKPTTSTLLNFDLLIYVAGADAYEGDTLGGLKISKEGLRRRDKMVFEFSKKHELPCCVVLAGGYAEDVNDVADIHFGTFLEMCGVAAS